MKKIFIFLVGLTAFAACQKSGSEIVRSEKELECEIALVPTGEILTAESPLSKADNMTDDIYCVQVYQEGSSSRFACGYFDNLESMKLFLKKGSSYKIQVAMIKNAKNLLGDRYILAKNAIMAKTDDVFCYEFLRYQGKAYYLPINRYIYNFTDKFSYYSSSISTALSEQIYGASYLSHIQDGKLNSTSYPTCTDWFYGEVTVNPNGTYQSVNMPFKRVGFKLKYELSGVTDGEVTVRVSNSTRTFIDNTTNTATYSSGIQFIAFGNTANAFKYADNDYTENLNVSVSWKRGIGVTQDLGTKTIQVKRNCLNNIKIVLGNDDRGAGVNMAIESDASMNGATTDIPVQ